MPRVDRTILWGLFALVASVAVGAESAPGVAVAFVDADGARHAGELTARTAGGFTFREAGAETMYRWDALGAEVSFGLFTQLLDGKDGPGWLDAAYLLETMDDGPAWADRALEKAVAADATLARAADALRAERVWFSAETPAIDPTPEPEEYAPPPRRTPEELGEHILAMAVDRQGQLWIGTEERGLWVENPAAPEGERWRRFSAPPLDPETPQTLPGRNAPLPPATEDEIAQRVADKPKYYETLQPALNAGDFPEDTVPALAVDRLGRVWAGHLRHGVSVWNGASWKTYAQGDGPIGHRVFAIKENPLDGDVWIATEAGLTRYRLDADAWTYYTMADGLASHQVVAFAFDPNTGDIWTGYDAYGVGRAARDEHGEYPDWQNFRAPESFPAVGPQQNHPPDKAWPIPNTPTGEGLPSDFINDVAVDREGAVWVATPVGLAWSKDQGASWRFQRGQDWEARVKGLYQPPAPQWTCRPRDLWMATDHVLKLVLDERGVLWAGFWRHPWRAFLPGADIPVPVRDPGEAAKIDFATVLLPTATGLLAGTYGHGVREWSFPVSSLTKTATPVPAAVVAAHPAAAPAPAEEALSRLAEMIAALPPAAAPAPVAALPDDPRTRGDWIGRHGTHWIVLGAAASPPNRNYRWGAGKPAVRHRHFIGPHRRPRDYARHWTHWLYTTDPRVPEMPPTYADSRLRRGLALPHETRRQAEWDDHGEAYPRAWDGPHLYCTLHIPDGEFVLSLYNFNKDGLEGPNRFRDYPISIRAGPGDRPDHDLSDWSVRREWSRGRFHQFRGGVWKRWYVRGPRALTVELQRHGGHNTILAAVALDRFDPLPEPYFTDADRDRFKDNPADAATALWTALARLRQTDPDAWSRHAPSVYATLTCYRAAHRSARENPALDLRLAHATQRFEDYEAMLRARGLTPARDIEKRLSWDGQAGSASGRGREHVLRALGRPETP